MSEESFNNCTYMIANIIMEILEGNTNYIGFFKPFTEFNNAISSNKIRTKLLNQIKNNLCSINNMRLKPDIISIEDYKKMCVNNYIGISENVLIDYPEINSFFELIEIPYLSLDEMIQCIQDNCNLSEICLATILSKIIKKYRYDFSEKTVEKISNIKIFVSNGKKVDAKKLGQYSKLDENYKHVLNDNCELEDIKFSFKKLGIEYNTLDTLQAREISNTNGKTENEKLGLFSNLFKKREDVENINNVNINITQPNKEHNISKQFESKKFPNIQKWRSTEVNLAEYLRYFDFVDEVKDVSVSNLGYDLEIKLNNGEKMYVEVKSMISFSQPFKITNNEYTCAHNYGDKYYIALVINDDDFKVKFIQNPIANLHFEKKCEQWSWFCEEYKVNLLDINEIQ